MAVAGRLRSLDAFRGFAIAAMVLVNNPGDWSSLYSRLAHAPWHGWTFTDGIFPFFLFIGGISLGALLYAPLRALDVTPVNSSLLYALLFNGAMFGVAWFMWRKKWFVKV